jgi:aconitate hydratase
VISESCERIHRSNIVGLGVGPRAFWSGDSRQTRGLTGFETDEIEGLGAGLRPRSALTVRARDAQGGEKSFKVLCRIDTPEEMRYYEHGGILPYVLRQLVKK